MNPELTPRAYAAFSDGSYAKMLENELRLAGFAVVHSRKNADLILTESDSALAYDESKSSAFRLIFFEGEAENAGAAKKKAYLPKIFSLEALERTLAELHEMIFSRKLSEAEERARKEQKAQTRQKRTEKREIVILPLEDGRSALVGDRTVKLSANEWKMLRLLSSASERGEYVPREALGEAIGHEESEGNIVDVYICHLRRKIELPFGRRLIFTVRGKGYILKKRNEAEI